MLCKVIFHYGPWKLWTEIENHREVPSTQFELEELAAEAVRQAILQLPEESRKHIAHDFLIMVSHAESWETINDEKEKVTIFNLGSLINNTLL